MTAARGALDAVADVLQDMDPAAAHAVAEDVAGMGSSFTVAVRPGSTCTSACAVNAAHASAKSSAIPRAVGTIRVRP